jgi:hypothetical protein
MSAVTLLAGTTPPIHAEPALKVTFVFAQVMVAHCAPVGVSSCESPAAVDAAATRIVVVRRLRIRVRAIFSPPIGPVEIPTFFRGPMRLAHAC